MIRRIVERLSRNTALRRRLPSRFGSRPLYLSGDSALSYLRPRWSTTCDDLLVAATKYARDANSVWDIGANCGVFAFAASHVAAASVSVLAVEADPFLAGLLQKSAQLPANHDLDLHVLCAAVSDRQDVARFRISSRGRSSNSLESSGHRTQAAGTRYIQHVLTTTLDHLLAHFPKPDVVKVDVEGAEGLVLDGATALLTTVRPRLYIEVGPKQTAYVTSVFRRYDYRLYDGNADSGEVVPDCTFNTLAVPAESTWNNR